MIASVFLTIFFAYFALSNPSSTTNDEFVSTQEVLTPDANASCNVTYMTVPYVQNPGAPTWVTNLLILSSITIGSNPVISEIGFLAESTGSSSQSLMDVVIYDSPTRSYPGTVVAKLSQVNAASFTSNTWGCVPLNQTLTFTVGQTLWIGFWNYQGNPGQVVSRQSRLTGNPYYYTLGGPSPSVGSTFPTGAYNSEPYQLVMGLTAGASQQCTNITDCGQCTGNSNCVWCLNSQACIGSQQIPQCPSWTRNPNLCHICTQFNSCSSCASVEYNCTWCETNNLPSRCISTQSDGNCTTAITNPGFCNRLSLF